MNRSINLCREDELPEGTAKGFAEPGVFLVRHAGRIHGWRDRCPHDGSTRLPWRRDAYLNADGSRIVCAAHGAQFEPATGVCTLGPCLGQSLVRVALSIGVDGVIVIDAPQTPTSIASRSS